MQISLNLMLLIGVVTDIFKMGFYHLPVFWFSSPKMIKCICLLSNGFWGRYQKNWLEPPSKGYPWSSGSITSKHSALTWAIFSSIASLVWLFIEQRLPVLHSIKSYLVLYIILFSIFFCPSSKILNSFKSEMTKILTKDSQDFAVIVCLVAISCVWQYMIV